MLSWLSRKNKEPESPAPLGDFDLDQPLFMYTSKDAFTIRDACEGVAIFGGIGSGKTSGSGATIARSYLSAGFGGLVLCSKPEERRLWEKYAAETGRTASLIVIEPGQQGGIPPWRFNFLDYELRRDGGGGGQTENVVSLLTKVVEIAEGKQQQQGGDSFWHRAMQEMVRNAVDLLSIAQGRLTLTDMLQLIVEAPRKPENAPEGWEAFALPSHLLVESDDAVQERDRLRLIDEHEARKAKNFCWRLFEMADAREKNPQQQHDFNMVYRYWFQNFAELASRTRSSIVATFTSVADMLSHGLPYQLLATDINVVPEVTFKDGAIIIVDISIQEYQDVGRIVQGILKFMFQRAILRRNAELHPRPVFLWADEAQNFVSSYDYQYQAVARSARACTVYLSQNLSNYYSVLGSQGHDEANALLGNFQTKIFHASDHVTHQYAADTIAQAWTMAYNFNTNMQGNQGSQMGGGGSQVMQYKVMPAEFTTLKKGGPKNHLLVEAIVFQGGRIWNATGETYLKVTFKQH